MRRKRLETYKLPPTFRSFDGESVEVNDVHTYVLLCSDDNALYNPAGITTVEALEFFLSHDDKKINTGYFFNYDVTMILQTIDDKAISELREHGYVLLNDGDIIYKVQHIPGKIFTITRGRSVAGKFKKEKRFKLYDTSSFYQCSFVTALKAWKVAPNVVDAIERMKLRRNGFKLSDIDEITAYCIAECKAHTELITKLDRCFRKVNIELTRFHGPGAVAAVVLNTHNSKAHYLTDNTDVSKTAYFGGRIQASKVGIFKTVHTYDLRSAYPSALITLPETSGRLIPIDAPETVEPYDLVECKWTSGKALLPWRDGSGNIWYRTSGYGIYHAVEFNAAVEAGLRANILRVYRPERVNSSLAPFSFINRLYQYRLELKDRGDLSHNCIKLALNSLYGKMAQKRRGTKTPPYQSYYIAGYITAYCRAQLIKAVGTKWSDVIMLATDGIVTAKPLTNLSISDKLGEWEYASHSEIMIFQPGFYKLGDKARTRGIKASAVDWFALAEAFRRDGIGATVSMSDRRFIAYTAGRDDVRGKWVESERVLSFTPSRGYPVPTADGNYKITPVAGTGVISAPFNEGAENGEA